MKRAGTAFLAVIIAWMLDPGFNTGLQAQTGQFYKGTTIKIVVGLSAGGGYDRAARILSRHLGKYIPGSPEIIVQNMPGAGSVRSLKSSLPPIEEPASRGSSRSLEISFGRGITNKGVL